MRVLTYKHQSIVFRSLVEIIKVLATVDGVDAADAICDAYRVAGIVGGKEMTKMLRGGASVKITNAHRGRWTRDEMAAYIKQLEEIIEDDVLRKNGQ